MGQLGGWLGFTFHIEKGFSWWPREFEHRGGYLQQLKVKQRKVTAEDPPRAGLSWGWACGYQAGPLWMTARDELSMGVRPLGFFWKGPDLSWPVGGTGFYFWNNMWKNPENDPSQLYLSIHEYSLTLQSRIFFILAVHCRCSRILSEPHPASAFLQIWGLLW